MTVKVTTHAIERARRRLGCQTDAEAVCVLSSPRIERAASIGATSVLLPSGHRVILKGGSVVTVVPKSCHKRNASKRDRT